MFWKVWLCFAELCLLIRGLSFVAGYSYGVSHLTHMHSYQGEREGGQTMKRENEVNPVGWVGQAILRGHTLEVKIRIS